MGQWVPKRSIIRRGNFQDVMVRRAKTFDFDVYVIKINPLASGNRWISRVVLFGHGNRWGSIVCLFTASAVRERLSPPERNFAFWRQFKWETNFFNFSSPDVFTCMEAAGVRRKFQVPTPPSLTGRYFRVDLTIVRVVNYFNKDKFRKAKDQRGNGFVTIKVGKTFVVLRNGMTSDRRNEHTQWVLQTPHGSDRYRLHTRELTQDRHRTALLSCQTSTPIYVQLMLMHFDQTDRFVSSIQ